MSIVILEKKEAVKSLFKPPHILQLNQETLTIQYLFNSLLLAHCELAVDDGMRGRKQSLISLMRITERKFISLWKQPPPQFLCSTLLRVSFTTHTTLARSAAECKYTVEVATIWINPLPFPVLENNKC